MGTYLINFLVYSMAMVGLLFVCLMVYKKTMTNNKFSRNNEEFSVENALNLSARKTLYVIRTGNERFLIASDVERTTFLAKLGENQNIAQVPVQLQQEPLQLQQEPVVTVDVPTFQSALNEYKNDFKLEQKTDYSEIAGAIKMTRKKPAMMKEILRRLEEDSAANKEKQKQA